MDIGAINKIIQGSDGEIVWEIDRNEGTHIYQGEKLAERILDVAIEIEPEQWKIFYKIVKTISIEDVNGKDCYKVYFTPFAGFERIRYYDKESYLIIKEERIIKKDKGISKEVFSFEDYEDYDGYLHPKTTKRDINGNPELATITTVRCIKNNIDMPEGIFDPPEEIKALIKQK